MKTGNAFLQPLVSILSAGEPFGRISDTEMLTVTRALAVFLGFA